MEVLKNKKLTNNLNDEQILEQLHKVEKEILDWFVKICEKNNLKYFLAGGTLLGTVRHKGFIPWDDDLDITMPRKDFEKFIEKTANNDDEKFFIQYHTTEKNYWLPFLKIRKRNTYFHEEGTDRYKGEKGIFIDIFPLDYAPKQKSIIQFFQAFIVKGITKILRFRSIRCGSLLKVIIVGSFFNLFSTKKLINIRDSAMKAFNTKTEKYFINLGSAYSFIKQTIPRSKFLPSRTLKFEGDIYNVPNDYDYILKRIYNNYMELPPLEKRKTHLLDEPIFDMKGNRMR